MNVIFTEDIIEELIIRSIEQESALLYFQPVYEVKKACFTVAEVLTRIPDGQGGILSPALFIPHAEKRGLIHAYGDMVLNKLCKFIKSVQPLTFNYSFNVSPLQLFKADFAVRTAKIIVAHGIDPHILTAEITESVDYNVTDTVLGNIIALKEFGIGFALDDMGKGASDLIKAARLPLTSMKIDRAYTENLENNTAVQTLIKNIVIFAVNKGMTVFAEGVETAEQKNILEALRCHFLQGYYFSKPLPCSVFEKILYCNQQKSRSVISNN